MSRAVDYPAQNPHGYPESHQRADPAGQPGRREARHRAHGYDARRRPRLPGLPHRDALAATARRLIGGRDPFAYQRDELARVADHEVGAELAPGVAGRGGPELAAGDDERPGRERP